MKKFLMTAALAATAALAVFGAACAKEKDNGAAGSVTAIRERVVCEVGYDFDVAACYGEDATVADPAGTAVTLKYGAFRVSEIGTYKVTVGGKTYDLVSVDSVAPMFLPLWDEAVYPYHHTARYPVNVKIGQETDLSKIFRPYDNSGGECTLKFVVRRGGYETIELVDGCKFTPENDFYWVDAYATDAAGNTGHMFEKLTAVA